MCCFSGPVERVERTRIFARFVAPARQLLVYQMKVAARAEVAMILPLPVPAGSPEDAVRFVSLEPYPHFFESLERAFPAPVSRSYSFALSGGIPQPAPLAVHQVGAFIASFIPTQADFARVDPRFRLPAAAFAAVPAYATWGFAVFQLRDVGADAREVHPMAFEFPTARPDALFFPTLHVHDGRAHPRARFDHVLYAQGSADESWRESAGWLSKYVSATLVPGLVDVDSTARRRELVGDAPNTDTWLAA